MELVCETFPFLVRTRLPELSAHHERARAIVLDENATRIKIPGHYSFPVRSQDEFFVLLYNRFEAACASHFQPFTVHPQSRRQVFAYVQNNASPPGVWHDHLQTATVNGVYYLAVPGNGGELRFRYADEEFDAVPEVGWLYLFPRWLFHRPLPQRSPDYRISLNIEIITHEHLISREGNWRW